LREFETVIQTQDVFEALHNFYEFSQTPSVKMRLHKHSKSVVLLLKKQVLKLWGNLKLSNDVKLILFKYTCRPIRVRVHVVALSVILSIKYIFYELHVNCLMLQDPIIL